MPEGEQSGARIMAVTRSQATLVLIHTVPGAVPALRTQLWTRQKALALGGQCSSRDTSHKREQQTLDSMLEGGEGGALSPFQLVQSEQASLNRD